MQSSLYFWYIILHAIMMLVKPKIAIATTEVVSFSSFFNWPGLFLLEQADYILCGQSKQALKHDRSLVAIRSLQECKDSFKDLIFNEFDTKPLVFLMSPENMTTFYNVLKAIREPLKQLSSFSRVPLKGAFMEKQQPVFIVEIPVGIPLSNQSTEETSKEKRSLSLDVNLSCFPLTSLVFLVDRFADEIWEIYCIQDRIMVQQNVVLDSGRRVDLPNLRSILSRRHNFRGMRLRVLAKNDPENTMEVTLVKENGVTRFGEGLSITLLNDLQYGLNFTVQAVDGDDCITQSSDGSLTGMGRQIVDNVADLSLTMSSLEPYRAQWLSFIHPAPRAPLGIFFRQPPAAMFRNILTRPVCQHTWVALGMLWILIIISAMIILSVKPEVGIRRREVFIWAIGSLCQQSNWTGAPSSTPMKIVYSVVFLASLVLFSVYSGSVVSLGLHSNYKAIKGFPDFMVHDYIMTGHFAKRLLNSSEMVTHQYPVMKEIVNGYMERNRAMLTKTSELDNRQGVKLAFRRNIRNLRFAHAEMVNRFYFEGKHLNFTDEDFCSLDTMPIRKSVYQLGFFVRKRSPFLEFLNYRMMYLLEKGTEHRMAMKCYTKNIPRCGKINIYSRREYVELMDTVLVFKILIGGVLVSLTVLIFEYMSKAREVPLKRL